MYTCEGLSFRDGFRFVPTSQAESAKLTCKQRDTMALLTATLLIRMHVYCIFIWKRTVVRVPFLLFCCLRSESKAHLLVFGRVVAKIWDKAIDCRFSAVASSLLLLPFRTELGNFSSIASWPASTTAKTAKKYNSIFMTVKILAVAFFVVRVCFYK